MKSKGKVLILIGCLFLLSAIILTIYNIWDENRAREVTTVLLEEIRNAEKPDEKLRPDYKKHPNMEMYAKEIEGNNYIGVLEIPALGLELPVIKEWSYPKLKISPCRYDGSAYQNNLIISAHNYDCHFGRLKSLEIGEEIFLTDMDDNVFRYEVIDMEVLPSTAVEDMKSGEWDLTLFTCTYGGQSRVTIRCELQ